MSKVVKVSATRISSFLSCKKKYMFQYLKHMPRLSNPSFKLGTACHEALELAGQIWQKTGHLTDADKKKVLKFYNELSVREGIDDMDTHEIGRQLVKNRINNFDLGNKIVSLEEKFGFPKSQHPDLKTSSGIPLIGAMDKVVELDEETLLIVDYKTSKTSPTPEQLKSDLQLSLYDLVAQILYPQYPRVILCLDMLKADPVFSYRTPEQRADFADYLETVYKAMVSFTEKDAKPSMNIFCPWCDFREHCDVYMEAVTKSEYEFLPTVNLTNEALVTEWEQVKRTAKILDMRKRELDMVMIEKIKNLGSDLLADEKQVFIRQNARTNYDPQTVQKLVPYDDYVGMSSISKRSEEHTS